MEKERVYIGSDTKTRRPVYLYKHSWDCDWYWGFGYIKGCGFTHTHFDSAFLSNFDYPKVDETFIRCIFNEKEWWEFRDLFKQAYALRRCAEVYRHGGYLTSTNRTLVLSKERNGEEKEAIVNADLEFILNKIWDMAKECNARYNRKSPKTLG